MSEPFSKQGMLDRIREAHSQLAHTVAEISPAQLAEPSLGGGWAVKDVLVHITWWEQRMIRTVQRALRGEAPQRLRHGDETTEQMLDRVNAEVFTGNQDRPVADILMDRQRSFANLLEMIDELSADDTVDPAPIEAILGGELVPLIAADTYAHYTEHERAIRAWMTKAEADRRRAS